MSHFFSAAVFFVSQLAIAAPAAPQSASADIKALGQSKVSGTITFKVVKDGVQVEGELKGLTPNAAHGFHIHEKGDCSAVDGTSAGGHFNPHGATHGAPDSPSHLGDLGNVTANAQGVGKVSVFKKGATLGEGADSVIGKGVIVHEKTDDLKTQPTGNAGARIGCGVIVLAK